MHTPTGLCVLAIVLRSCWASQTPPLSASVVAKLEARMRQTSTRSWEVGTALQALTELHYPERSVFGQSPFPILTNTSAAPVLLSSIVDPLVRKHQSGQAFFEDGSSADPASVGGAVLLASAFAPKSNASDYTDAVQDQLDLLLDSVPRTDSGAISHRNDEVQIWSDTFSMQPTFLAYVGAVRNDKSLLTTAATQCQLIYDILVDDTGRLRHVMMGGWQDEGHWGTGNGWAVHGMVRVLATLDHSSFKTALTAQRKKLASTIDSILQAGYETQADSGALLNYMGDDGANNFEDVATSSLFSAASYRLAQLGYSTKTLADAEKARTWVQSKVSSSGSISQVVNPYAFAELLASGTQSPEALAFVLDMHSAYRDYTAGDAGPTLAAGSVTSHSPTTHGNSTQASSPPPSSSTSHNGTQPSIVVRNSTQSATSKHRTTSARMRRRSRMLAKHARDRS